MRFYPTLDSDSVRSYLPAHPLLLPASSWGRRPRKNGALPVPCIPPQVPEIAADSGGFAAARRAKKLGLDDGYSYTLEQYVAWLQALGPRLSWCATMDYCVEPAIADDQRTLRQRQAKTTEMAWSCWQRFRHPGLVWVATVQGWSLRDYHRHAQELRPLLDEMASFYGSKSAWRVGIGSLCTRTSLEQIRQVCEVVAATLPDLPLHLWGVSLRVLGSRVALPRQVVSTDSSCWNRLFGRQHEEWRTSGLSQRQWTITVALPAYLAAVESALATPKQLLLPLAA